jgi:hypothetical protein
MITPGRLSVLSSPGLKAFPPLRHNTNPNTASIKEVEKNPNKDKNGACLFII